MRRSTPCPRMLASITDGPCGCLEAMIIVNKGITILPRCPWPGGTAIGPLTRICVARAEIAYPPNATRYLEIMAMSPAVAATKLMIAANTLTPRLAKTMFVSRASRFIC
jgi:hypothetical protein